MIDYGKLATEQHEAAVEIRSIEAGDGILNFTDAVTLARISGLLDPTNEIRGALLEGGLKADRPTATRWAIRRGDFDGWLDGALQRQEARRSACISLAEARSRAREAGLKRSSDRLMSALNDGEIEGAERIGIDWLIGRDKFEAWLADQVSETPAADGTISLREAVALSRTDGLRQMGDYLLLACMNGEIEGAYRDGASWRIPYESYQAWVAPVIAACQVEPEQRPHWLLCLPWHVIFWLAVIGYAVFRVASVWGQ
jgi:hypothetical protein